jgi:predicted HAD superfamily Cof-like phosphohydrolase
MVGAFCTKCFHASDTLIGGIRAFQEKFGFPVNRRPDREMVSFRRQLTDEEFMEAREALWALYEDPHSAKALEKVAAETIDLIYVLVGTLVWFGVSVEEVFAEIHRANMEKGPPVGFGTYGKPTKPDGWRPPDIRCIIERTLERRKP